jgi:MtN3 and saliva related transmembrane protein
MIEIIGFLAGILVASSSIPQILKSWRTKSTKDLSLGLMSLNLSGQILWIVYGVIISSLALVIMSSITLVFALSLLILKLKYR